MVDTANGSPHADQTHLGFMTDNETSMDAVMVGDSGSSLVPQEVPDVTEVPDPQDLLSRRLNDLRAVLPEAFADGEFDLQRLSQLLGKDDGGQERFGLRWPGKAEAMAMQRTPATGTLVPDFERSIDFDNAPNVVIEGDNLETLRVLSNSLLGRVKLIYIDPPYNFNGDFVYNDNFGSGIDEYLRLSGQIRDGQRLSSNSETDGRYHSKWLSMMYPRLALARALLQDDGAIFVSIDDHEVAHLRLLMDEIFGPENFVAQVIWQRAYSPKNQGDGFSTDHEYVIAFARNMGGWKPGLLPRTAQQDALYKNPDHDPRGPWMSGDSTVGDGGPTFSITRPNGSVIPGPPPGRYWSFSEKRLQELDADNRIWWGSDGNGVPRIKRFLSEVRQGRLPQTIWPHNEVGHSQDGKRSFHERVAIPIGGDSFQTTKPIRLMRRILQIATRPDQEDVVLDFFAGTGTMGDAVMQQNAEDGGNRRFILVQLPEPCPETGYATICDITHTRLISASKAIKGQLGLALEHPEQYGFKYLRLDRSNFRRWQPVQPSDPDAEHTLLDLLEQHNSRMEWASDDGIVQEVLLRMAVDPGSAWRRVEVLEHHCVVVQEEDRRLVVCLSNKPDVELARRLAQELSPTEVIMLNDSLSGRDAEQYNIWQVLNEKNSILKMM